MVAVFAIFATLSMLEFKMMGVGLAVAVLIDATIVRCLLVPAVMVLFGRANWWLPRWLSRLPRIGIEGEEYFAARDAAASAPVSESASPRA
jgi:RND superfamily putative drug exporter